MSLLDQVIGGLMGGGASSPIVGVLTSLLGGGGQQVGTATSGLAGMGGGGIGSLVSMFEQAGLGHIAQSWVGNGPNHSVSPEQLQSVLGHDRVQGMSNRSGMQSQDFLTQLSQHLPNAVNGMTPNGRVPDEGTVSV